MRYARLTVLGLMLVAGWYGSGTRVAIALSEARAAVVAADTTGATAPAPEAAPQDEAALAADSSTSEREAAGSGKAVIDTAASARREAEFRRTPIMPEVFIHQWRYREPAVHMPDSRSAEREVARLGLAEAVHEALTHNPGVAAQRLTPLRQQEDVRRAEAIFDPALSLSINKDRREAPNSSTLYGTQTLVVSNVNGNATLKKKLRTGADFAIDFTNNRLVSNARQGLVPQYKPELVFSLNQPLLRNFGANFAYLLVDITAIGSEAARYTYRAQLADFVKQVVGAYWAVVFARENLAVQRRSLELARQTLHENTERVRVGLLAPVAVKEAESEAAAREAQVIVAENALDVAQRTLRQLVFLRTGDTFVPRQIEPIEEPHTTAVAVDGDAALAAALEQRPEILAQNLDVRSKNLTARVRENQLLPRADFVGNVGLNGLAGDPQPITFAGQTVVSEFGGSYGKALDRLTTREFYSYKAGVEIEIPIGNAAAKAEYTQAKIDVSQAELDRRQLLSNVTLEVGKAVNDVITNMKRIQSTRVARELAEENLSNQQKRLDVGMATTKDILDFQDKLTTARGNEVQAATDYNVSLAELARAKGTLLDEYSVVVEVPGKRFAPWWAQF
jgi:outer membrane protein TolC